MAFGARTTASPARPVARLRRMLDAPSPLPLPTWLERHQRASLALSIWITLVIAWSAAVGHSGARLLAEVTGPLVFAVIATRPAMPLLARELGVVCGLFTGAAIVASLADASVIAPVGYFLAFALTAVYERRSLLRFGLVVTVFHELAFHAVIPRGAHIDGLPGWAATAVFAGSFVILTWTLALPWSANGAERAGRAAEIMRHANHLAVSELVLELDHDGRVTDINDHGLGVLGVPREALIGANWVDLTVEPAQRERARAALARLIDPEAGPLATPPRYFQFEHAIVNGAGQRRVFRWRTTVAVDAEGTITGTVTSGTDITEARRNERQILREQRDLASLALIAKAVARETDAREAVITGVASLADASLAGLLEPVPGGDELVVTRSTRPDLVGLRIPLTGAPGGNALAFLSGEPVFVADAAGSPLVNRRVAQIAGGASYLFQPVLVDGEPAGVLCVAWDEPVSELGTRQTNLVALAAEEAAAALHRLAAMQRWEDAALTDPLTGIPNRRAFERRFSEVLRQAAADGQPLAVALMDLNGFKLLNDTEGHAAGDRVLKECAALWAAELRPSDVLARLGGDEFAVLLPSCGVDHAEAVAGRLRGALRHEPGCGVGIAVWDGTETSADLLARTDEALYADKARHARERINEAARLAAVDATGLVDAPIDPELDDIACQVSSLVGVPTSGVTMITPDRQFFAAHWGLPADIAEARELPLEASFCQHPATTGREMVVSDTRENGLLCDNSSTKAGFHAYVGIPLSDGRQTVAVLCAFDTVPRSWTRDELDTMRALARRAEGVIARRAKDGRAARQSVARRAKRA